MKKVFVIAVLVLLCALPGMAQDYKVDVFAGYSLLHSDPGSGLASANASGWEGALTYNWNDWLGVKADVDGHYCCDSSLHNFLFGPQITLGHGKVSPYLHGLVGVSHGSAGGFTDNAFAFALGGGLDVKATDRLSVRIAQVDYLGTRFADYTQNNFRFSAGLVFRFGKK
jgi:opacity protein-like surface antigen